MHFIDNNIKTLFLHYKIRGVKKTNQTGRNRKALRVGQKNLFFMKKLFSLIIVSLLFSATSWAQDRLPAAGDYSIGFDAAPMLKFAGSLLTAGNEVNMNWQQDQTLVGSYFKSDDLAYRGRLGLNMSSSSSDDTTEPEISSSSITLMAGLMKIRRGDRIMGYYGAEAGISMGGDKSKTGSAPEVKTSSSAIMARGFVGAQYFIWPKISIGAEYGLGLNLGSSSAGEPKVKSSSTTIGNDNAGGQIVLSVYF